MVSFSGIIYRLNTKLGLVQRLELEDPFSRIIIDAEGKIWVTRWNQGVAVIDFDSRTIRRFLFPESQETDRRFIGIIKDSENNIWIGERYGIYIINADQNSYRFIGVDSYNFV